MISNWVLCSAKPDMMKKVDLAWAHWLLQRCDDSTATYPVRKMMTKEHLADKSGVGVYG